MDPNKEASSGNGRRKRCVVCVVGILFVGAACFFAGKCSSRSVPAAVPHDADSSFLETAQKIDDYGKSLLDRAESATDVEELRNALAKLLRLQGASNETAALSAFHFAKEALKDGNRDLAKIYCLNAISHAPERPEYLEAYRNLFPEESSSAEDLDALLSVLQLACYTSNADDVEFLRRLITDVSAQRERAVNRATETVADIAEDADPLPEEYAWKNMPETSAEAITWLRERLAALEDGDTEDSRKTEQRLALETLSSDAAACLSKAEKTLNSPLVSKSDAEKANPDRDIALAASASQIQVANGLVAQIWVLDFDLLELPEARRREAYALSERVNKLSEKYAHERSRRYVERAKKALEDIRGIALPAADELDGFPNGDLTGKRLEIVEKLKEADENLKRISSAKALEEIQKELSSENSPAAKLQSLDAKRRIAYNLWAIGRIRKSHEASGKDDQKKRLREIDQALLNPAVSALFATVYSNNFASDVEAQIEIAEHEKLSLDDF